MKFKAFFTPSQKNKNIIQEDTPVFADYETWGSSLERNVSQRSQRETDNDTYFFQKLAEQLNITVSNAVNLVKQQLFNELFLNNTNPANTEVEYREAIFNALTTVIEHIENQYNIRIRGGGSLKTWTARIISNLAETRKEYGLGNNARVQAQQPIPRQRIRQAIEQAAEQVVARAQPAEPELTGVEKLIKRTINMGHVVPVPITPQTREAIYGIRDIDNPNESALLKVFHRSKLILGDMTRGVQRFLAYVRPVLPVGPVYLQGIGRHRFSKNITPRNEPYFKFSYNFAKSQQIFTNTTRSFLDKISTDYQVQFYVVYITYKTDQSRFLTRVVGTTRSNNKILYYESTPVHGKKQVPSKKYLSDTNNQLYTRDLKAYWQGQLAGWRRNDIEQTLNTLDLT
jgi:hypothetical protein